MYGHEIFFILKKSFVIYCTDVLYVTNTLLFFRLFPSPRFNIFYIDFR